MKHNKERQKAFQEGFKTDGMKLTEMVEKFFSDKKQKNLQNDKNNMDRAKQNKQEPELPTMRW